jgi:excisionase family DNA binding protein
MNKELFTNFDKEDLKAIIIEAIKEANSILPGNNYQENSTEDYLDQREAAKFLRITLPTIISWKKKNKIPYFQEGRKILFKKSELLHVLRKNESLLR